jgi:methionine sulfoxide reductase heme-binding subunit
MKKFFIILIILFLLPFSFTRADDSKVDYKNQTVIDSDLDGLTDEGEKQIFKTDPNNPDTDGDGFFDGAEIIGKTNPLNNLEPINLEKTTEIMKPVEKETPWAWYSTRMGGLVGFSLLAGSIFLGLAIRTPILNKIIKPVYSYDIHRWISLQALVFAFVHATSLLFDKYLHFGLVGIFVPFQLQSEIVNPILVTLGILGFYLMIVLVVTSYLKKYISQKIWRIVHFSNIILYALIIAHAYYLGTDLKIPLLKNIFIGLNGFLILLFLANIFFRTATFIKSKPENNNYESLG